MAVKHPVGFYRTRDPEELSYVKDGQYTIYINNWWLVDENGWLVFYYRWKGAPANPQCNPSREVITRLAQLTPRYGIKQVPLVLVPHHCEL